MKRTLAEFEVHQTRHFSVKASLQKHNQIMRPNQLSYGLLHFIQHSYNLKLRKILILVLSDQLNNSTASNDAQLCMHFLSGNHALFCRSHLVITQLPTHSLQLFFLSIGCHRANPREPSLGYFKVSAMLSLETSLQ